MPSIAAAADAQGTPLASAPAAASTVAVRVLSAILRTSDFFLDPRSLARKIAQVVELRAADIAPTLDGDVADRRAVCLEHALDALAVRDLAHGECRVESAVALGDHDAFVRLHALAVAFHDLHLHDHGVA